PSSAPGAKASTVCPQQLDHKDARVHCAILNQHTNPTPTHHPTPQDPEAGMTGMQDSSRKNRHPVACFFRTPTGCRYPPPTDRTPRSHRNPAVLGTDPPAERGNWPVSPPSEP